MFRGHQYDHGLAWVHFPTGFGGIGVRPELQALVERRLRQAGARAVVMRNILGEQVLGLPGEPRLDNAVPWNEVPRS